MVEPLIPDQSKIRLVDEGGGIKRVPRPLAGQAGGRKLAELGVDNRQQVGGGLAVAAAGRFHARPAGETHQKSGRRPKSLVGTRPPGIIPLMRVIGPVFLS